MNNPTTSIRANVLRRSLPIAFAIAALAIMSARAHAQDPDQVTVSAPQVKTIGREFATLAPIEQSTVKARVAFDPVTLTTNSGVALLRDSVFDAAIKACAAADPGIHDDGECVNTAVRSAQPQVDAAIARAKITGNG